MNIELNTFWIPLSDNKLIFVLSEPNTLDQICGKNITQMTLKNSGILEIPESCVIKTDEIILSPRNFRNTKTSSSYLPSFNITTDHLELKQPILNKSFNLTNSSTNKEGFLANLIQTKKKKKFRNQITKHF